jgi:outer membrane protein TolC
MKKLISFFWLIVLSVGVLNTYAQENQNTFSNVEEVITVALDKNPDLNIYLLQQDKATADYKINKNYFLPTISGTASFQNNLALSTTTLPGEIFGQPDESVNVQIGQKYNYNAGINLSKTIFDREAKLKAKVSKISAKIAQAQTEIYKQTLKEQTAFYYYSALIGKQAVKISTEDFKISDSIYQLTIKKFEQGLIDITIKNQAEISKNKVKQSLLSNENIYNQSLNNLKLLLGINYQSTLNLTENIDVLQNPTFAKINLKIDKNLELKTLQEEQSVLSVKKEKSSYLPKLSINSYFGKQQLSDDFGVSFKNNSWTNYSYVAASINVPIFSGFSKNNKVKMAKIDNTISIENLKIEKAKSTSNDQQLLAEYTRNITILKSSQNNYRLTKKNTDLALQKYEQGLLSLDAYFKLYEDYLKAENNYLNTLSIVYSQYATILSRQ